MKPTKRQKLCHNCEGDIDIDVIVCPFCAADLREEKPEMGYSSYVSTTQPMDQKSTMQSLYPASAEAPEEEIEAVQDQVPKVENAGRSGVFTPTILFTLGVQLSLFGVLMLLFSHKGIVILKWDARFWFFYILAAIPFLTFGYKSLSKL